MTGYFGFMAYNVVNLDSLNPGYSNMRLHALQKVEYGVKVDKRDYHFGNHILRNYVGDTLHLYSDAVLTKVAIREYHQPIIPISVGTPSLILKKSIETIQILNFYYTSFWADTKSTQSDKDWLMKGNFAYKPIGDYGVCGYGALISSSKDLEIDALLEEMKSIFKSLSQEESLEFNRKLLYARLEEIIEQLRLQKVVVFKECAC